MADEMVTAFANKTPLTIHNMSWKDFLLMLDELGQIRTQAGWEHTYSVPK